MSLRETVSGKKILFVCPEFHHYHVDIIQCLRANGATVYFIPTFKTTLSKRVLRKTSPQYVWQYYQTHVTKLQNLQFEFLLQIKGDDIPYDILKDQISRVRTSILYQWDSLKNCDYMGLVELFDKVFTFDRKDAGRHHQLLVYLPLFYKKDVFANIPLSIDLLMVAGCAPWRYELTERIFKLARAHGFKVHICLYIPLKTLIKMWIKGERVNLKIVRPWKVNSVKYARLLSTSSTVLDIPSPLQSGLSIRTIETLGAGKKLITTNQMILFEEFYSSNSVLIIDEQTDGDTFANFIRKEGWEIENLNHLELNNWLERLLNLDHNENFIDRQ